MRVSTLLAMAAALLGVRAAPTTSVDSKAIMPLGIHAMSSLAVGLQARDSSDWPRMSVPETCIYGLSGRASGASIARVKDFIKVLKQKPNDIASTQPGNGNRAYFLYSSEKLPWNFISVAWRPGTTQPKVTKGQLATGLEKILDTCAYSPKGAVNAQLTLSAVSGQPRIQVSGKDNWEGNDDWCLEKTKREEFPELMSRAPKTILPGQCFQDPAQSGVTRSDIEWCLARLEKNPRSITLPQTPTTERPTSDRQDFFCYDDAPSGRHIKIRAVLNVTCPQKISSSQVIASVRRILNKCKSDGNMIGGTEYLDGNDQVFVDVYSNRL